MTRIGIGLPGRNIEDVRSAAIAVADYNFDSFSVYGDLGDLPPYAVLHAVANRLAGSTLRRVGPLGTPVGLQHPEVIARHAVALEEQLPGQSSVGLVRGAFLEAIGQRPARLGQMKETIEHVRRVGNEHDLQLPITIGGFGPKLLALAGQLSVEAVKLGGSTNPALAVEAKRRIGNDKVEVILGAVTVIDPDRRAARGRARLEVAKYLDVVGRYDHTLDGEEQESLALFRVAFNRGDPTAPSCISDSLLDKFALAGTSEDALEMLTTMDGVVDRFEFGTPHGLSDRASAIRYIATTVLNQRKEN